MSRTISVGKWNKSTKWNLSDIHKNLHEVKRPHRQQRSGRIARTVGGAAVVDLVCRWGPRGAASCNSKPMREPLIRILIHRSNCYLSRLRDQLRRSLVSSWCVEVHKKAIAIFRVPGVFWLAYTESARQGR